MCSENRDSVSLHIFSLARFIEEASTQTAVAYIVVRRGSHVSLHMPVTAHVVGLYIVGSL